MNGCTIPYTPIAVDFWKVRQLQRVRLFFLSHAHLDPSCGITSSWSMPIYCSPISRKILLQRFQLNQDVVHALELNVPHMIPMTGNENVTMTVTLIDAYHCPGSVMFLFEGYFGRILYTGDFRFKEEMLTTPPFISITEKPIDVLYMDNTYCSPKCHFPVREVARQEVIAALEQHPKERIVIGLRNLGKEDLLTAIASHFNVTIKVSEERYKTLELLGVHEHFSTSDTNSRIEVVQMVDITRQNMDIWNKEKPTIAILPTAIFTALGDFPFHGQRDMIVVPYSDHSSYVELHRFVAAIKPKSIIPIVKADVRDPLTAALLDRTSVECFLEYLNKTPMKNYHIPPAVLEFMNQSPSRGGSSRKASIGRRALGSKVVSKATARGRKNDENMKCASSCTPVSLEHKSKMLVDVKNSVASSGLDGGLETSRIDVFSSSRNVDFQECLPASRFGSKLGRCSSLDRLCSPCHRSNIKLRLNRAASPDLRMQLKRKIGMDVKSPSAGLHSNLVRTRRVRLCNVHLCRTLCHSSRHCKSLLNDRFCRTTGRIGPVIEANRGKEVMPDFTIDIQKTSNLKTKEAKKNSDSENSADLELAKKSTNNKRTTEEFGPPKYSNCICLTSVVHDRSNTHVNASSAYTNTAPSDDAIDLRSKGQTPDKYVSDIVLTSSPPKFCTQHDQNETVLTQGKKKESEEFVFSGSGISIQAASGSNVCNVIDSKSSPLLSSTCAPVSLSERRADATSFLQAQQDRELVFDNFTNSVENLPSVSNFRDFLSSNGLSDLLAAKGFRDIADIIPQCLQVEPCSTSSELKRRAQERSDQYDIASILTNAFAFGIASLNSVHRTSFDSGSSGLSRSVTDFDETKKLTDVQCNPLCREHQQHSPPLLVSENDSQSPNDCGSCIQDPIDCVELKRQRLDTGCCPSKDNSNKSDLGKDELNLRLGGHNGKMALHTANAVPESALPPKKHWRQRFGMAQLHRISQENKWAKMEQNSLSKLLIANGTNEGSKDLNCS